MFENNFHSFKQNCKKLWVCIITSIVFKYFEITQIITINTVFFIETIHNECPKRFIQILIQKNTLTYYKTINNITILYK